MIIFANPFLGKTTAITDLNLQSLEINNKKIGENIKNNPSIKDLIGDEIISAEKDNLLMSMYFDVDSMVSLISKLKELNRPLPIIIGCSPKYIPTIKKSIEKRAIEKKLEAMKFNTSSWAKKRTIKRYYKEFKYLKKLFPELRAYKLGKDEYLSDILENKCQDIIQSFKDGNDESRIHLKKQLRKEYKYII